MCHLQVTKVKIKITSINQEGFKYKFAYPLDNLLSDINTGIRTRSLLRNIYTLFSFMSYIEPKYYAKALEDPNWTLTMQDELNKFERNQVSSLTSKLKDHPVIGLSEFLETN